MQFTGSTVRSVEVVKLIHPGLNFLKTLLISDGKPMYYPDFIITEIFLDLSIVQK